MNTNVSLTTTAAQNAPLRGARIRKCAQCGQSKPIADYAHAQHKRCSKCCDFTNGGKLSTTDKLRRIASMPLRNSTVTGELYDGAELRPFDGRLGAMDAYRLPSRVGQALSWPGATLAKTEIRND